MQAIKDRVGQVAELQSQPDHCAIADASIAERHSECAALKEDMQDFDVRIMPAHTLIWRE